MAGENIRFNTLAVISLLIQMRNILCKDFCVNGGSQFNHTFTQETKIDGTWFSACPGALHVDLSNNKFGSVENTSFDNFYKLQTLDLSNNNISVIESGAFVGMRSLQFMYLQKNELEEIPIGFFGNLKSLITVDLSFNKITHLPLAVLNYSLPAIKEILLHNNRLTAFEPWAYFRQPIRLVDVRFNNITTFTNDYNWTYVTRSVYDEASTDLRNNSISEWHDWYLLQYKDQEANDYGIESVLVELLPDIRENPFICDCNAYNLIKKVRQSFYRWSNSEYLAVACYDPPQLRGKRIFYDVADTELVCNISENCPKGCQCQDRPEQGVLNIDCRNLNLTEVPVVLPKSPYDKIELELDNNDIKRINNVTYLPSITKLSMLGNSLITLPEFVIIEIANEENPYVDFRNNALTSIPAATQNIKFEHAQFSGNDLVCECNMLWMVDWISLAPRYTDKSLNCTFEGKFYKIIDLNGDVLKCHNVGSVILIVVLSVVLFVVIVLLITAKKCPYETKVLLFRIFRIHPADRYKIDESEGKQYDMYVSFDDDDPYVTQWVQKILIRQLEGKKPFYQLSIATRNMAAGAEADARLQLIEESRRLLVILSQEYENNQWCEYEISHSETLEQNEGRIIYLLYDKNADEFTKTEPWLSKMTGRKVFNTREKMLWSKLRYELPVKPLNRNRIDRRPEYINVQI